MGNIVENGTENVQIFTCVMPCREREAKNFDSTREHIQLEYTAALGSAAW